MSRAPARHRIAVIQRPAIQVRAGRGVGHLGDQPAHHTVPPREVVERLLEPTRRGPRLECPRLGRCHTDPIDEPAGRHEVVHEVPARTHHDGAGEWQPQVGDPLRRNKTSPRRVAGESGFLRPEQLLAHNGVDAVRADHHVGGRARSVGEAQHGARVPTGGLLDPDQPPPERDLLRRHPRGEHTLEVGAVHVVVGKAVLGDDVVTERTGRQQRPVLPAAHVAAVRAYGNHPERVAQSEPVQDAAPVRADLDPRPHLMQPAAALVDHHLREPRSRQAQSSSQTTNAGPNHSYPHTITITRPPGSEVGERRVAVASVCSSSRESLMSRPLPHAGRRRATSLPPGPPGGDDPVGLKLRIPQSAGSTLVWPDHCRIEADGRGDRLDLHFPRGDPIVAVGFTSPSRRVIRCRGLGPSRNRRRPDGPRRGRA